MNDLNKLINEIISEDQEIREEIELLDLKYKLIDELINFRKSYKINRNSDGKTLYMKVAQKDETNPNTQFARHTSLA